MHQDGHKGQAAVDTQPPPAAGGSVHQDGHKGRAAVDAQPPAAAGGSVHQDGHKGRAAVDARNWQIKEEVTARVTTSSYRNEFRPWTDVKPVKPIKAKSQFKLSDEKMNHQTSYSMQFTAEGAKPTQADNKFLERRRIRTLYSEPYKEPSRVEKPSPQPSKPKKTTASHKPLKKAKDKQMVSGRSSKKKSTETASGTNVTAAEEKEKSKEMNNKLAEAKETPDKATGATSKEPGSLRQKQPLEVQALPSIPEEAVGTSMSPA
ncbi:hypothetical protein JRQ81_019291 [Phrynocephalus forsythii]|uniref:Microtubule-associated protein 6 n=1 Tax=Phrynocephalus forsythii TaxID=171643 RepID=A0A9Q0XLM2_9SAUR|nr:hypothetical protein JRQ81_019291 [Phrynocephalus forsythii]